MWEVWAPAHGHGDASRAVDLSPLLSHATRFSCVDCVIDGWARVLTRACCACFTHVTSSQTCHIITHMSHHHTRVLRLLHAEGSGDAPSAARPLLHPPLCPGGRLWDAGSLPRESPLCLLRCVPLLLIAQQDTCQQDNCLVSTTRQLSCF